VYGLDAANRALLSAAEVEVADKLLACGQQHLFEHWPAAGTADDDKHRFLAQAAVCDAGYPGGGALYKSSCMPDKVRLVSRIASADCCSLFS
jgi:hypothetical protein